MTYHINFDGKILPCRARMKKCPYGSARHASTYEELYDKAMTEFSNVQVPEQLSNKLNRGIMLNGLQSISTEVEKSKAPLELVIATLDKAIKTANNDTMPYDIKKMKENAIQVVADVQESAMMNWTPEYEIPNSIEFPAHEIAKERVGKEKVKFFSLKSRKSESQFKDRLNKFMDIKKEINEVNEWEQTHTTTTRTEEERTHYVNELTKDFNAYSKALNTSKLLTRPEIKNERELEAFQSNLRNMTNAELLALYDDLNISDSEMKNNLNSINNFNYIRRTDLSDTANDNIEEWYKRNQIKAQRYVLRSSKNVLISMAVAKEFLQREKSLGNIIKATKERER